MKLHDDIDSYDYKPRNPTTEGFKHSEPESDDTGLPEHPIYSNYAKYLWKAHRKQGGVQSPNRSHMNSDNQRPTIIK
jgi:hypothetical protein